MKTPALNAQQLGMNCNGWDENECIVFSKETNP